jgi:hypothetical protein
METNCSTYKSQWYPTSPSCPLSLHPTFRSNQSPGLLTLARAPYSDPLSGVYLIARLRVGRNRHPLLSGQSGLACVLLEMLLRGERVGPVREDQNETFKRACTRIAHKHSQDKLSACAPTMPRVCDDLSFSLLTAWYSFDWVSPCGDTPEGGC